MVLYATPIWDCSARFAARIGLGEEQPRPIGRQFAGHGAVNHSAQEYVRAYFWHTNTVENYFSILKRGIYGCYFHVSETHLHRYTAEFDFRYNNRIALGVDDQERANRALKGVKGKRLTYRTARREVTM